VESLKDDSNTLRKREEITSIHVKRKITKDLIARGEPRTAKEKGFEKGKGKDQVQSLNNGGGGGE